MAERCHGRIAVAAVAAVPWYLRDARLHPQRHVCGYNDTYRDAERKRDYDADSQQRSNRRGSHSFKLTAEALEGNHEHRPDEAIALPVLRLQACA